MQNIARDSENSSEEEFFDAHGQYQSPDGGWVSLNSTSHSLMQPTLPSEGFWDSDEVFPKEMTKWNSNDFIDAFASPIEAEGVPGNKQTNKSGHQQTNKQIRTPATITPSVAGAQNSSFLR